MADVVKCGRAYPSEAMFGRRAWQPRRGELRSGRPRSGIERLCKAGSTMEWQSRHGVQSFSEVCRREAMNSSHGGALQCQDCQTAKWHGSHGVAG